jgi:hypothetical protein
MAAPPIMAFHDILPSYPAAGMDFAASQARPEQPGQAGRNQMMVKIALAIAAILALAPAVATIAWPDNRDQQLTRAIELHGPVLGFTQSKDRIQVRLVPAKTDAEKASRSRVVIRSETGAQIAIPLQHGQTWASADLPAELADAGELAISVE